MSVAAARRLSPQTGPVGKFEEGVQKDGNMGEAQGEREPSQVDVCVGFLSGEPVSVRVMVHGLLDRYGREASGLASLPLCALCA